MFGNFSNIVWSTSTIQAEILMKLNDEDFFEEIKKSFNSEFQINSLFDFLPHFQSSIPFPSLTRLVGKRGAFPLKLRAATSYAKPRVVIVG